jgi:hypothetical protein
MSRQMRELVAVSVSSIVRHLKSRVYHLSQLSIDYRRRRSKVQPSVMLTVAALELVGA